MTSGVITTQLYGSKGWTDHYPVYTIIKNQVPLKNAPATRTRRRINQTTTKKFKEKLAGTDFSVAHVSDPNEAMDKLMDLVMGAHHECFPLETVKVRKYEHESRFMTKGLINSCRTKDRMLKNMTKNKVSKTSPSSIHYRKYRNLLTTLIRKQKKRHYNDEFEKHKNDIRKTLDLVKEVLNKSNDKHSISSHRFRENGQWIENNQSIADGFNKFYASVGPTTNSNVHNAKTSPGQYLKSHSAPSEANFAPQRITPDTVTEISKKIAKKTSCDHYGISQKMIIDNMEVLAPSIAHVWNQSIDGGGVFPRGGKVARVIPVYKGKNLDASLYTNYRPISLLPIVGKILERIMYNQMMEFFTSSSTLYGSQYGFRSKHSTIHAMLDFVNFTGEGVDGGEVAYGVFCDLSKAFDTLNHENLLRKLDHYGIRGAAQAWFRSYLTNRTQYVYWMGESSERLPLSTGVPQGSVLGPLLFFIYINDLPSCTDSLKVVLFADDSNLILKGEDPKTLAETLTTELEKVNDWFAANKLLLNPDKTKLIVFKSRKCRKDLTAAPVTLNGKILKQVTSESFLGVQLDEILKWYEHTGKVANNISRKIGMMSRVKHFVSRKTLRSLYFAFVHPHIIYGITLWGATFDKGLSRIKTLQKKAIRLITGASRMDHCEPRQRELGILKVDDLYKVQTICLAYDCLTGQAPAELCSLFRQNGEEQRTTTRSITNKPLDIKLCNQPRKAGPVMNSSFLLKAPELWNQLPESIQQSHNKAVLRSKLKKHFLDQYATVSPCTNALCSDLEFCHHIPRH